MRVKALLALVVAFAAVSASLSISQAPAKQARPNAQCSLTSTGLIPLTDMGNRRYRGYRGGLYPAGAQPPLGEVPEEGHDRLAPGAADQRKDRPALDRHVERERGVLRLQARLRPRRSRRTRTSSIVDGAQDGFDAHERQLEAVYWDNVDSRLAEAGVSAYQVQVVWLKEAIAGEHRRFPKDAKALQTSVRKIINTMRFRYPKLRLVYLSSRTYGGYAITGWNPGAGGLRQRLCRPRRDPGPDQRQAQRPVGRLGPVPVD